MSGKGETRWLYAALFFIALAMLAMATEAPLAALFLFAVVGVILFAVGKSMWTKGG